MTTDYGETMSLSSVLVINGPNLNLLGSRETSVYGTGTLAEHLEPVAVEAASLSVDIESMQSNSESEIVEAVHAARGRHDAIIINAGAFTHYSWAIHDALRAFEGRVIEVHLSNPVAREGFRHVSVLAGVADGSISGFGGFGYVLALRALVSMSRS